MSTSEPAKVGSTVFQIITNGQAGSIVPTFEDAMVNVGVKLAGSRDQLVAWRKNGEFDGLDTPELAGSFFHRIRYAMDMSESNKYKFEQHEVTNIPGGSSLVRSIPISNEFDPGYELQYALNTFARGIESAPTASAKLEAFLKSHVAAARQVASDEQIIAGLKETHQRMGGFDFVGQYEPHGTELLDWLPEVARSRFDELAEELRPSSGMKI
jgi:hypothetical protein